MAKILTMSRTWRGGTVTAKVRAAEPVAATAAATFLLSETIPNVPIEFGNLRNAGGVLPASAGDPRATIFFDSVYAAVQHEVPMNHPRGGQDHYLLETMRANYTKVYAMMAKIMRGALGG